MSSTKIITVPNASEPTFEKRPEGQEVLGPLNEILGEHFYKPDYQANRIVLGTIKAHYLDIGDPAWLFAVAPPGTGKTTMSLMGTSNLPEVIALGDFTENTFLSGFYGHKTPGILERIGRNEEEGKVFTSIGNAIFTAKDFTTVLSMKHEKRAVVLGQLREIHDGEFRRDFGTGETKIWRGRVTIIAAVTPALDRHCSVFSTLGERFLQVRWHRPDSEEAGLWAIRQQGQEDHIRGRVREAVGLIFNESINEAPVLTDEMGRRIACLSEVIALGRTHVSRSQGGREIEYVPEPKANTRISKGLAALAKGVAALNRHTEVAEQDLQDAFRVGLDSISERRRCQLLAIFQGQDLNSLRIPRTVLGRDLDEMEVLNIIEKVEGGSGWKLTDRVENLLLNADFCLDGRVS